MLANRVWAWVFRGTESDRRTGFVEMSDADARGAIVGGRAQDPMVGLLKLKHIDHTIPEPEPPEAPPEEFAPKSSSSRRKVNGSKTVAPAPIEDAPKQEPT